MYDIYYVIYDMRAPTTQTFMTKRSHVHWECKCQCVNLLIGYNIFSEICLWRVERQERLFWCSLTILRLLKVKAFIPAIAHSQGGNSEKCGFSEKNCDLGGCSSGV